MSYRNMRGLSVTKNQPFEGIINNLRRRYRETESSSVREDLSRYVSVQPCPECHGGRLNEAARHVFVDDVALPDITDMPVNHALEFFQQLSLPGKQGRIASKIIKEITIAQIMAKIGYYTGHFGKWHLGPVKANSPTNPGKMGFHE